MNARLPRTFAVVVTYFPDMDTFIPLLDSLLAQTRGIVVVDNTPQEDRRVEQVLEAESYESIRLIRLGSNQGVARALNVGIEAAEDAGATHVLLSDQDSLPAPGMVDELMKVLTELEQEGRRVGAVGPVYTDRNTGLTYPFQVNIPGKFFYGHRKADESKPILEVLTLITSGTLIPFEALRVVGGMREDLFLDHVDNEWCHRARHLGYSLFGAGHASMFHHLGEHALRVWYFGWQQESAYSPLRVYYRVRNYVALCRMRHIALRWKIRSFWWSAGFVYSQVAFGRQRAGSLRMAVAGLWDGVRGRLGPWRGRDASS